MCVDLSYVYGENVQDAVKATYRVSRNLAPLPSRDYSRKRITRDFLFPWAGALCAHLSFRVYQSRLIARDAIIIPPYDNDVVSRNVRISWNKNQQSRRKRVNIMSSIIQFTFIVRLF